MSSLIIDEMTVPWLASSPAVSVVTSMDVPPAEAVSSNWMSFASGSNGESATTTLGTPLDLTAFDEIRFWVRASQAASGSAQQPFLLQFEFVDAGDLPGEAHHWLIPVNRAGHWELRRIDISSDRRLQVSQFRLRALTDRPVSILLSKVFAVREEMLVDCEAAIAERLAALPLPGLEGLPFDAVVASGSTQVVLSGAYSLQAGNRLQFDGGDAGSEQRRLIAVSSVGGQTTVDFIEPLLGNYPINATASLTVPLLFEQPAAETLPASPLLVITLLDAREDLRQSLHYQQRDSFRRINGVLHAGVRPAPRVYMLDYQITLDAPNHRLHQDIHLAIRQRLSRDLPLWVNGTLHPLEIIAPPELPKDRRLGLAAPMYLRVYAPLQPQPRSTVPLLDHLSLATAHLDPLAPAENADFEQIRIEL